MRIVALLILVLCCNGVGAQQSIQYSFKHFTVENGLASNTIGAIAQDHEGFIWMATINGLQRYDGNSFITFRAQRDRPGSIPSNHINRIYQDRKKHLWLVGDNNRIGIFNTKKFTFTDAAIPDEKRKFYIPQELIELPTGELMLLKADGSLLQYDEKNNRFGSQRVFPFPVNWKPTGIAWDASIRRYWISCDSGLLQYDPARKLMNYRGHNPDAVPLITAFGNVFPTHKIFVDPKYNVIFTTWPPGTGALELCRFVKKTGKAERHSLVKQVGYHELFGFVPQRNGRLWIYGLPFFMEWKDERDPPFETIVTRGVTDPAIKFDYPFQAFEDKEGNIWIATDNGVFLFNPETQIFNTYNLVRTDGKPPRELPVQAVAELKDGRIFVGCWGAGLFCYDQQFNPLPLPSSIGERGHTYSIWDMVEHPKTGQLWICMQGGRLAVYDPKTSKTAEVYPEIFKGSTIRQVDEDTSGNLWFGTHNGRVIKWDFKKSGNDPSKGYEFITQLGMVHKLHYDYSGAIWVGSLGEGLVKIDARTHRIVKRFTSEGPPGERLFMDSPGDMTYFDDTTLLVSAGCINIVNTKTNKISFISTENGLPSNTTESIERDAKGILWVGMTNGICRLNLQKRLVGYYDRRDGIAYDKFTMSGVRELADGRIIFFTDHNFLVFDPEAFGQQNLPPKPYITSFSLGGQPLSIDSLFRAKRVVLQYNNTSIGIDFSALSYLQQRKLHYYYMLEGLDDKWIHTDRPEEVVYNYLPPGNYTFKVRSENGDGLANAEIASIPIVVRPPFWNSWWFYGLVTLLIILVLYLIDRERINKRQSLQQMRSQIAGNLATDISYTLNNINVMSEIAKIKADKNIEQSKEYIDQISTKSRLMIEAMDDMLWSIHPDNDSMRKTLFRLKELTDGFRAAYGIDIDLIVDHKVQSLELDMKLRHELFFFYKETLQFLQQHVCCRQVFVNINQVRSRLMIEILTECVAETGEYRERFMKLVRRRVEAMSATIDVVADNKSFSVVLYVQL